MIGSLESKTITVSPGGSRDDQLGPRRLVAGIA
jgi:hypothetical protein